MYTISTHIIINHNITSLSKEKYRMSHFNR